ncbi:NUDIX domain protein [Beauveria bassiana ARSEF 2860]|uniref:NUDIX domain protein n=1 Tax=Beauveria bassiana (strain ARSEF 2860) TaxID=655819 RepID=J4W8B1_BEAB2|nr:NUDIX domain protein [Beauveria bassiana ARSEF 2860]EJP66470.1 NUDIX domain protein [Beauveria bassiana ARSEF 2860]
MAVPNYTFDASLARFNISKAAFIAAHPPIARVMAAAMVFRPNPSSPSSSSSSSSPSSSSPPQTLLLCRAATDSYPLKWEIPGGSVDADDATILDAVARELWEETGLTAAHMVAPIVMVPEEPLTEATRAGLGIQPQDEGLGVDADGLTVTFEETGRLWGKVTALVTTAAAVRGEEEVVVLRDEEHGEAAWVTEEDVQRGELPEGDGTKGRRTMDFVSDGVRRAILDGFRVYEKSLAKENNGA